MSILKKIITENRGFGYMLKITLHMTKATQIGATFKLMIKTSMFLPQSLPFQLIAYQAVEEFYLLACMGC